MYKLLLMITFLLLLSSCTPSMEDQLIEEFETQGWECSNVDCILEEDTYSYSYNYIDNIVIYIFRETTDDFSVKATVEINLITGEASMNYARLVPSIIGYRYYGNVVNGEYECVTFDTARTYCISDYIDIAYIKVVNIIEEAGYLISDLE